MKYIKKFTENFNSNIKESLNPTLNIWYDSLLKEINAKELDIFETFFLPLKDFRDNLDIDSLSDNIEFINSLSSLGLKKSDVKNSEDYETFLNKPIKWMMIYNKSSNELQNPEYILIQVFNKTNNYWQTTKLYKINSNIKNFYNKLTSKTIEIKDGDKNYIYNTSNGSDWNLLNTKSKSKKFKSKFRKEELFDLIDKFDKMEVKVI